MMPKRLAETPVGEQIPQVVGSGPFVFDAADFRPGVQAIFTKNVAYVPRKEPSSWTAGGKVVNVDKVTWRVMPDMQTALNALQSGDVDMIEQVPIDLLPVLQSNDEVKTGFIHPFGAQVTGRFNWKIPPFDKPEIREAAVYALDQKTLMETAIGNPKYFELCPSVYGCEVPLASNAGSEYLAGTPQQRLAKAQELLKKSGYDGTPVVMMQPTDLTILSTQPIVAADELRKAGFKVDVQTMDWATLQARKNSDKPVSPGRLEHVLYLLGQRRHLEPARQRADRRVRQRMGRLAQGPEGGRPPVPVPDRGDAGRPEEDRRADPADRLRRQFLLQRRRVQVRRGLEHLPERHPFRPGDPVLGHAEVTHPPGPARRDRDDRGPCQRDPMGSYILRRLLLAIPVMLFVAVGVFLLLHLAPGDPAQDDRGGSGDARTGRGDPGPRSRLDQPLAVQFFDWLVAMSRGDFGVSLISRQPALRQIGQRVEPTVALAVTAIIVTILVSIPLGILAAWRHGRLVDKCVMALSVTGFSIPVFVVGYVLIGLVAVDLHLLPVQGYRPIASGFWPFFSRIILPSLALSSTFIALVSRMTRAAMLEVLREDYVRTARAKGLPERLVLGRHALRNAAVPILTVLGTGFAMMVSGVVVTETVFNIPGLGRLVVEAVLARDYPVIQAVILLTAMAYVAINLLVDLSYALTDPRIRYK